MRLPIQVLVYPALWDGDRWLYMLLHRTVSRGAFWQGVTGGVEDGEGLLQAARRELVEETGFVRVRLRQIDYSYTFPLDGRWKEIYPLGTTEVAEHVFVASLDGNADPVIDPGEHDEWRWCDLEQAIELLSWPENKTALIECDMVLRSPSWNEA